MEFLNDKDEEKHWFSRQRSRNNTVSAKTKSRQSENPEQEPLPPQIPQPQPPPPPPPQRKPREFEWWENTPPYITDYSQDCTLVTPSIYNMVDLTIMNKALKIKLDVKKDELKRLESDIEAQIYHNSHLEGNNTDSSTSKEQNGGDQLIKRQNKKNLINNWEILCKQIKKKEDEINKKTDEFINLNQKYREMKTKQRELDGIENWKIYDPITEELIKSNSEEHWREIYLKKIKYLLLKEIRTYKREHKPRPDGRQGKGTKKQGEAKKSKKKRNVSGKKSTKKKRRGGKRARTRGRSRA